MTKDFLGEKLPFLILLAFAIWLRVFALENLPGFLGDEAWGFAQVNSYLRGLPYQFDVPSGRMLNPIYGAIIFIFHTSDPFYMRFISVVIGVVTIALSWRLFRNLYDGKTASAVTLIAASFSLNIHYSRLAWDCCLIPPASLVITYFILRRQTLWFLVSLAIGFSIHPTMIFFFVPATLISLGELSEQKRKIPWKIAVPVVFTGAVAAYFYLSLKRMAFRIPDFMAMKRFIFGLLDFVTGTVISQDMSDNRIYYISAFVLSLALLSWRGRKSFSRAEKNLFGGILLSFIGLFLVMGVWPVLPGRERLILYAGFPLCLYIGLLVRRMRYGHFLALLFSAFYLLITLNFLFDPIITSRTPSLQFRSGPEEPKYAAIKWILKEKKNGDELSILAEEWGIYWNAYNFALGNFPGKIKMFQVSGQTGFDQSQSVTSLDRFLPLMEKGTYAIGFRGGHIDRMIREATLIGSRYSRIGFKDYSGDDYIYVWIRE